MAGGEERVQAETRHLRDNVKDRRNANSDEIDDHYQDGEEGEAKPSFPEMAIAWVTSTNVVVCKEKCSNGGNFRSSSHR